MQRDWEIWEIWDSMMHDATADANANADQNAWSNQNAIPAAMVIRLISVKHREGNESWILAKLSQTATEDGKHGGLWSFGGVLRTEYSVRMTDY